MAILDFFIENSKDGINEIAVHIATESELFLKDYPWYKNGSKELDALLNFDLDENLSKNEIKLISHSEI